MKRNYTIDFLRGLCMIYIVGIFHLSQYLGNQYYLNYNEYGNSIMWSCLGTFSLISGYLIGRKYSCRSIQDVFVFYKNRIIRFYPLFIISSISLFLIGYNDIISTIYGLSGLSPFVSPKPHTLWYISMIMTFYLISPIILTTRKRRLLIGGLVLLIFFLLSAFITIDKRFIFNLSLYLFGMYIAISKFGKMKDWRLGGVLLFLIWFSMLTMLNTYHFILFRKMVDVLGVFVLVIIAYFISSIWSLKNKLVYFFSYVSMSIYLFHRLTYWACLKVFNPENIYVRLLYLVLIALPIGLAFAFLIQKLYDKIIRKTNIQFRYK